MCCLLMSCSEKGRIPGGETLKMLAPIQWMGPLNFVFQRVLWKGASDIVVQMILRKICLHSSVGTMGKQTSSFAFAWFIIDLS